MQQLIFNLSAGFGSTSHAASNEIRKAEKVPARSAILGVVGAALGIDRLDRESQRRLTKDYHVATRIVSSGSTVEDFHTVHSHQQNKMKAIRNWHHVVDNTPITALNPDKFNTSITRRQYKTDNVVFVGLEYATDDPMWTLEEISTALQFPKYVLYFGRKSCVLSMPTFPQVYECDTIVTALNQYKLPDAPKDLDTSTAMTVYDTPIAGVDYDESIELNDVSINRKVWSFRNRTAYVINARS